MKPGPKGASRALIKFIVEIKEKNPRYGSPKIAYLANNVLKDEEVILSVRTAFTDHAFIWSKSGLEQKCRDIKNILMIFEFIMHTAEKLRLR